MALSEAEKRRRRFLKEKNQAGGTFDDLQKKIAEAEQYVYFTDDGDILALSPTKIKLKAGWKETTFKPEQLAILDGKNIANFRVRQDPEVETVFTIETKPIESLFVKSEDDFVKLIDYSVKGADVSVSCKDKKFVVKLDKKQRTKYRKIGSDNATAKGSKLLKFYFTSINDPHFLVYTINVHLKDLIDNEQSEINVPANLNQCSIYTIKLFDKYVRT